MSFWIGFIVLNFICFLPMYLLNLSEQKNPIDFLFGKKLTVFYLLKLGLRKINSSDPFRFNLDFSLVFLLLLTLQLPSILVISLSALVLVISEIYLIYLFVMLFIFKRPPVLTSDLTLLKSGLLIFKQKRFWILLFVTVVITLISVGAPYAISWLTNNHRHSYWINIIVMLLLLFVGLKNWKTHTYPHLHWRNCFSTGLHFLKNLELNKQYDQILNKDDAFYHSSNLFSGVSPKHKPNMVFLCVESYGAIVYQDPEFKETIVKLLSEYRSRLNKAGFNVSS